MKHASENFVLLKTQEYLNVIIKLISEKVKK